MPSKFIPPAFYGLFLRCAEDDLPLNIPCRTYSEANSLRSRLYWARRQLIADNHPLSSVLQTLTFSVNRAPPSLVISTIGERYEEMIRTAVPDLDAYINKVLAMEGVDPSVIGVPNTPDGVLEQYRYATHKIEAFLTEKEQKKNK